MPASRTNLSIEREFVNCPLCESNDTRLKLKIDTQNLILSSLWKDGIEYPVSSIETLVQCKHCGMVFVNPRIQEAAGVAVYTIDQEMAYFASTYTRRLRAYQALIQSLPRWYHGKPETLLDIGCGDGLLVEVACQSGLQAQGIEISPALVNLVNERLGANTALNVPVSELPSNRYDVVTLINVIEHLRNPVQMLQEIFELLCTGGLLVIHAPNFGGLPARLKGARWHQIEPFAHFNYFTYKTLSAMLEKTGFKQVNRFSLMIHDGWIGRISRMLDQAKIYLDNGLGIVARKPGQ